MITSQNETLVTVKYTLVEAECSRCGHTHSEPIETREGEFDSTIKDIVEFFGWSSFDSTDYPDFDEELKEGIWEHFYNAINFFCANGYEDVEIEEATLEPIFALMKEEIEKLKENV